MATYAEIQQWVRDSYGFTPKTCWIAHIKAENGKTDRIAANRIDNGARKHPCPLDKRPAVENALRHLSVI